MNRFRFLSAAAPFAVLLAVLLAGWGPLLGGQRILFFGDISLYFVPLLDVQRNALHAGHLALWDPYVLCGKPVWGNPQAWPLYPSSLLLYVLRPELATGIIGALHLFWAACGTLLFLRRRGLGRGGSLLGALAWGFGAALVSKMQFPNMVQAASFLPWLLWSAEGIIAEESLAKRPLWTAIFGLLIGGALLAAHPQMFLMSGYITVFWILWRGILLSRSRQKFVCWWLIAGFVAGVLLAAAQLLPTLELARVSVRPDLSLAKANRFILPPYAVLYNFLLPNFYGNPATAVPFVARGNYWEGCCYAGILPFAFAFGAVCKQFRKNREVRFWTVVFAVCVWLAVGKDGGLFTVAFRVLPGLSRFHDPARWLVPGTFALACLAAHGADEFLQAVQVPSRRQTISAMICVLAALDLLAFDRTLNPTAPPNLFEKTRQTPLGKAQNPRVFFADEGRAWGRWISYRTYDTVGGDNGKQAEDFVGSGCPNLPALARIRQLGGYEPVARADVAALAAAARQGTEMSNHVLTPEMIALLRNGGVSYVAYLPSPLGSATTALRRVTVPGSWGRSWLQPAAAATDNSGTANKTNAFVPLAVEDLSPNEVIVCLPPKHPAGIVVLADTLHPGWIATIDAADTSVPIMRVNGAFRGVLVPKEAQKVRFRYLPDSVRIGLFTSLVATGILVAVFVTCGRTILGRFPCEKQKHTKL